MSRQPKLNLSNLNEENTPITLAQKQFLQISEKWKDICNTYHTKKIMRFWNSNSKILSVKGSFYLKFCISNNDIHSLTLLLDHQISFLSINKTFNYGIYNNYTPILYASRYSSLKTIQLLCSKGADVNLSSNTNILEYIFENSNITGTNVVQCAEYLVKLGCAIQSNAIWCLAYYNPHKQFDRVYLASFLKENGADLIHITTAIKYGHLRLAKWLIQNKCKIYDTYLTDVKTESGINLLLENGINDINHNDIAYGTALFYHSQRGNINAVKALLKYNADKNIICTKDKLTALQIAKKKKHKEIIQLLTEECNNDYDIDFNMIPMKPNVVENDIKCEEKYYDETNATCVLIENKIEMLQNKLKREYKKILELRKEQMEANDKIEKLKCSLNYWNDFILNWNKWNIRCFVEWLKRINCWKAGSFQTYFKSDEDAIMKIQYAIKSDPLTFGGNICNYTYDNDDDNKEDICDNNNNNNNNVTFGQQLRAFDRYTLYKIGIKETRDCNVIANEIKKMLYKDRNNNKNNDSDMDDNLCIICWDRNKTHVLNCGHRFCSPDIKTIQKKSNCCPICKAKITIVIKLY
eukprot:26577_1